MATHPFSWIGPLALPRLTLLLNHVVSSEVLATAKLQAHAGRAIDVQWKAGAAPRLPAFLGRVAQAETWTPPPLRLLITPAGLFEAADDTTTAHAVGLTLTVTLPDPMTFARMAIKGERPEVNIEGDAALAETASWLMKNLRWDLQDDVARWLGNTPAELLRHLGEGLRQSLTRWRPGQAPGSSPR
jgi:ubiquinone biosynthesis protein UbiJ